MKTKYTNKVKVAALVILMTVFSSVTMLKAQDYEKARTKTAIGNLINGINSENFGLKRSAIYFAGKYQVKEVVPELLSQLTRELDASTRILIGLTIYSIGDQSGINKLRQIAETESNARVKRMFTEICEQYSMKAVYSSIN